MKLSVTGIPAVLHEVLVENGYKRRDKRHWWRQLSPRIITGITISELARGGAASHDAEVICSLSDTVIDNIRYWQPGAKPSAFPFPSFTQKLTENFPDGQIWNPSYPRGGSGDEVRARFDELLTEKVLPFFTKHGTPESALELFLQPGGASAFEVAISSVVEKAGLEKALAKGTALAKKYGVSVARRDSFLDRLRQISKAEAERLCRDVGGTLHRAEDRARRRWTRARGCSGSSGRGRRSAARRSSPT